MKRYSDEQIDQAMLLAMERAVALELDPDKRARGEAELQEMRDGIDRYPQPVRAQMRLHLRLFLEAILQLEPARPGTPADRQQRIRERIERRQEKWAAKKGRRK